MSGFRIAFIASKTWLVATTFSWLVAGSKHPLPRYTGTVVSHMLAAASVPFELEEVHSVAWDG